MEAGLPCWQAQPNTNVCPPSWLMPSMLPTTRPARAFWADASGKTGAAQDRPATRAASDQDHLGLDDMLSMGKPTIAGRILLRVCPKTLGRIAELSEHEAD